MNIYKDMPEGLKDLLSQYHQEGSKITYTGSFDGYVWLIEPNNLDNWVVIIEWFEGAENYGVVNICEDAYNDLKLILGGKHGS